MLMLGALSGCDASVTLNDSRQFPVNTLETGTVTVDGHTLRVWLAKTAAQQAEGLMYVPADQIADDQGMLFIFPEDNYRSFWMKNTITPLDIAFARSDGEIVKIWQMPALTLQSFPSLEPARFALEVKAGTLGLLGVKEGDRLEVPAALLKGAAQSDE
jgi:hypothetical protein